MQVNKIYNQDCLEGLGLLDNECIDLTVTSPPYDNLRLYNGYYFKFEEIAKELYRVMKPGGVIAWIVGDKTKNGSETGTSFRQALYFKDIGFNLHDTMIYEKNNPTPQKSNRYQPCFEYMFILSKGKPKTFNPIMIEKKYIESRPNKMYDKDKSGMQIHHQYSSSSNLKIKNNIWKYNVGLYHSTNDKEAFKHPAIFPEQLAADHILSWSNEGDIILDPFMGSGSSCLVAAENDRRYVGIELKQKYYDLAVQRIQELQ